MYASGHCNKVLRNHRHNACQLLQMMTQHASQLSEIPHGAEPALHEYLKPQLDVLDIECVNIVKALHRLSHSDVYFHPSIWQILAEAHLNRCKQQDCYLQRMSCICRNGTGQAPLHRNRRDIYSDHRHASRHRFCGADADGWSIRM